MREAHLPLQDRLRLVPGSLLWTPLASPGGTGPECEGAVLGTEGQVRGVKPTCMMAVAFLEEVPGLLGAGAGVFLLGWRLEAGEAAEPLLPAGAPGPSLFL